MAENKSIQSPDFDKIRKETGVETERAFRTLYFALDYEISTRRRLIRDVTNTLEGKVISVDPGAQQDNFDTERALIVLLTGTVNRTFTGFSNGYEGRVVFVFNVGTATYTFADESASSDEANRFQLSSGGNETRAQDTGIVFLYLNSRWRELTV